MTDRIEIPTTNLRFSMIQSYLTNQHNDCDDERLPEVARLALKTSPLPLPVIGLRRNRSRAEMEMGHESWVVDQMGHHFSMSQWVMDHCQ